MLVGGHVVDRREQWLAEPVAHLVTHPGPPSVEEGADLLGRRRGAVAVRCGRVVGHVELLLLPWRLPREMWPITRPETPRGRVYGRPRTRRSHGPPSGGL